MLIIWLFRVKNQIGIKIVKVQAQSFRWRSRIDLIKTKPGRNVMYCRFRSADTNLYKFRILHKRFRFRERRTMGSIRGSAHLSRFSSLVRCPLENARSFSCGDPLGITVTDFRCSTPCTIMHTCVRAGYVVTLNYYYYYYHYVLKFGRHG